MKTTIQYCLDKMKTSGGSLSFNINKNFQINISLDKSVFDLFSEIYHGKQTSGELMEDKQVMKFGESSTLIIRRSTRSRLLEIRLPSIGQMENMIRTNAGWTIGTDGDELVIKKDRGRE